jgi:DNA invertase Pin-like site-specific DNA recombinase
LGQNRGRLTLNVLLSFAQFEREVIGERIRDKIAAKKKGMWMGGVRRASRQAQQATMIIPATPSTPVHSQSKFIHPRRRNPAPIQS